MDDWIAGTIPWSVDDLADVMAFEMALRTKPKDDWDVDVGKHVIDFGKQCLPTDGFRLGQSSLNHRPSAPGAV